LDQKFVIILIGSLVAAAIASVIDVSLDPEEIYTAAGSPAPPVLISTDTTTNSSDDGSIDNITTTTQLNVVTSVSPITNIVKNIGGDRIKITGLVPEGVNSHTFELVPSDIIKIQNADLVIIDGLNLEGNIEKTVNQVQSKNHQLQLLKLGDNTITKNQWIFDFSFPKENDEPNPHLWLNVAYAMKFANLTRDKLIEMDPQNAEYYSSNAERYILLLKKLDKGILQAVQTVPPQNRKLLTYHDSPSDFGEPTPMEVAKLIEQIRSEKVPAIFASEVFPSKVVDQIAREANVKIVETLSDDDLPGETGDDPTHTYVGMMLENMRNMLVPLGGNVTAVEIIDPRDTYTSANRGDHK
jgi:ABC-type Zn uptake system ZnuABC Zn-binding protein ZnuA